MTAADEAYDRLHGVDGHTQAAPGLKDLEDAKAAADTPRYTSSEALCRNRHGLAHPQGPCWACDADARLKAAEAKLALVAGLLAAYGEAEGTPVDYEFLVHHIGEAIK